MSTMEDRGLDWEIERLNDFHMLQYWGLCNLSNFEIKKNRDTSWFITYEKKYEITRIDFTGCCGNEPDNGYNVHYCNGKIKSYGYKKIGFDILKHLELKSNNKILEWE